jgi:outer membrane protein OmpA-like peptidoglycan-associated protein
VGAGIGTYMDRQEEELAQIPGTTVERSGDDVLVMRMDSDVFFAPRSASLTASSKDTLDRAADVLLEYPKTAVVVQGYSDDMGSESANMDLSERRAEIVRNYLIGQGVEADRMVAVGYGDTERGREGVEILIKAKAT